MRKLALVAASSALMGGLAGAGVALFATSGSSKKAPIAAEGRAGPSETPHDAPLEERLANIEQAVRVLERRGSIPLRAATGADAGSAPAAPGGPSDAPTLVDDPVFEAAVRDVIDRVEIDRDTEREVRREDRRKQLASRWADDMTPRLGLSETQKAKLLEIAQQLMSEMGRLSERDAGAAPSRTERRAEMQKLREQSEQKLRSILDPGQMRTYDGLADEDKLGFPRRRGGDRGERGETNR